MKSLHARRPDRYAAEIRAALRRHVIRYGSAPTWAPWAARTLRAEREARPVIVRRAV